VDKSFEEAHGLWFRKHWKESGGERRRLLERRVEKEEKFGEDAAEKRFLRDVWWPVFGCLDELHPEYETVDALGRTRFLDIAYIRFPLLADIEIDGFGPHLKNVSRYDFADERRRDAALGVLGWRVLRFSYDDVRENPLLCRELLRRWMEAAAPKEATEDAVREEVIRLGYYQSSFGISDVMKLLGWSENPARSLLKRMLADKMLVSLSGSVRRVHQYALHENYRRAYLSSIIRYK